MQTPSATIGEQGWSYGYGTEDRARGCGTLAAAMSTRLAINLMEHEMPTATRAAETDDLLAVRCRSGDKSAFDAIVSRYQERLMRFSTRVLGSQAEGEDAAQEALIRAYRAMQSYRTEGLLQSWLYRITLNECRRRIRRRKLLLPFDALRRKDPGPGPEELAVAADRAHDVRNAVAALPDHYRIVMVMFYFENMSVDEISRTAGISVSAVKVRLHRARERLRHGLAEGQER
jgi:RNA polymerase sigma-70 factor (ECF subfamily)